METISRSLLTFLINSLWQIPLAAVVATLICRMIRGGPATHRHAIWLAALAAAIVLPLGSIRTQRVTGTAHFDPDSAIAVAANHVPNLPAQLAPTPAAKPSLRALRFTPVMAGTLVVAYLLILLYRLGRLARASFQTLSIRYTARAGEISEAMQRVAERCERAFDLLDVKLLFSTRISGPVTAGGAIILPETLRTETSEDLLTTAIGHEMAHIARHDFATNVLYELVLIPLGFHPAIRFIRQGIEQSRELACDEMVTRRLIDSQAYARSIMSFAVSMTALPRPGYTLGVFDGDILEERIRRLIAGPVANLRRARLLFAAGLGAMVLCAVGASTLALTAHAQSAAALIMQQAQAASKRGDVKQAAELYESAVKLEPSNLEAKVELAHILAGQLVPGTDPANPLAARAHQLYLDALAINPRYLPALDGIIGLQIFLRQFADAHEWAVKTIQSYALNPNPYYTAGFVDWSMVYPDYASARVAAGMGPGDPGIIPNATVRQNLRTQHAADVEDGLRMLQIALQLDPNYADAMAYMNLLYRIKAGYADTNEEWKELTAQADEWVKKALAAKKIQSPSSAHPANPGMWKVAPLPPPLPPPPPPPPGHAASGSPSGAITQASFPPDPPSKSPESGELIAQGAPLLLEFRHEIELRGPRGGPQNASIIVPLPGNLRCHVRYSDSGWVQTFPRIPDTITQHSTFVSETVQIGIDLAKDGSVSNARVVQGSGDSGFDEDALKIARETVFHPGPANGNLDNPVGLTMTVEPDPK
jgi:TonB family protein